MQPRTELGRALTPQGQPFTLTEEGGALVVRVGGALLMSSRMSGSEAQMAAVALESLLDRPNLRVLVAGLGLGYTLRAVLTLVAAQAQVTVCELMQPLVDWHRGPLGQLTDFAINDPRAHLAIGDVTALLQNSTERWDAILLDVDNGPDALTHSDNAWLYGAAGLRHMRTLLQPGGQLVVWSAHESPPFVERLKQAGFSANALRVRARGTVAKGGFHWLLVGAVPHVSGQDAPSKGTVRSEIRYRH